MTDEPRSEIDGAQDHGDGNRAGGTAPRIATRRVWALTLTAGLLGGLAAWVVGEAVLQTYRPALEPPFKPIPTLDDSLKVTRARVESGAAIAAATSALVGFALGVAGGAARRSVKLMPGAGGAGLLLGAVLGAAVGTALMMPLYANLDPQSGNLLIPLLGHIGAWSVAGLAGGFAFGAGAGGKRVLARTTVGGLVGVALASVVYELVGALAFPTHETHLPIAGSPETRALALVLVGLGAAIGAVVAVDEPKPRRPVQG